MTTKTVRLTDPEYWAGRSTEDLDRLEGKFMTDAVALAARGAYALADESVAISCAIMTARYRAGNAS